MAAGRPCTAVYCLQLVLSTCLDPAILSEQTPDSRCGSSGLLNQIVEPCTAVELCSNYCARVHASTRRCLSSLALSRALVEVHVLPNTVGGLPHACLLEGSRARHTLSSAGERHPLHDADVGHHGHRWAHELYSRLRNGGGGAGLTGVQVVKVVLVERLLKTHPSHRPIAILPSPNLIRRLLRGQTSWHGNWQLSFSDSARTDGSPVPPRGCRQSPTNRST